jgi:hypothetical protein
VNSAATFSLATALSFSSSLKASDGSAWHLHKPDYNDLF